MNILLLSRYGNLGASSRIRFYQYLPYLREQGVEVMVAPLLSDNYLRDLYAGKRLGAVSVLAAYTRRIRTLMRRRRFDLLWIEYELFPWLPSWLESLALPKPTRYLVDYDDAIFHRYGLHTNPLVRRMLGHKIDDLMRRASMVVVGNEYLRDHAIAAGAEQVEMLPTVVDAARYQPKYSTRHDAVTIGWIGSPSTRRYLQIVLGAISRLQQMGKPIRLIVVGGDLPVSDNLPIVNMEWSEAGEVGMIQSFDVGIMPLLDSPWERGKCGYKLIQYMACGKPVVASPVGVNRKIVEHGTNGFLAGNEEEWVSYLSRLIEDPILRTEMGKKGRARVESEFSLELASPRLLSLMHTAANQ